MRDLPPAFGGVLKSSSDGLWKISFLLGKTSIFYTGSVACSLSLWLFFFLLEHLLAATQASPSGLTSRRFTLGYHSSRID